MLHTSRRLLQGLFFIWLITTTVVLLSPAEHVRRTSRAVKDQPLVQAQQDTVAYRTMDDGDNWHLFWFFGLAALGVSQVRSVRVKSLGLWMAGLNLYGMVTEIIQEQWIPGRAFEWSDMGLNAVGIGAGVAVAVGVRRMVSRWVSWQLTEDSGQ